jgi:histidinol-phosphate aminotransferase
MNPVELARPEIRVLQPYSSARMEACGGSVWLNANESPWPPQRGGKDWNRYPDPQPAVLCARLAELYGVPPDRLLVGRGSDEGIDLLVRAFCVAGRDSILISPPTFGMYATCARVQGAGIVEVPLGRDFALDVDAVLAAVTPSVKLVFACSPNNPAGAGVPRADILRLATALDGRALLVVDEAYVEFADPQGACGSVVDRLHEYENLVVLRTLSKAWALAGVRLGCVLADARVIALLRKIMPPYPLPAPCVEAALNALAGDGEHAVRDHVAAIRGERVRMREELSRLVCVREVWPSQANFLAVRFADAGAAYTALLEAGVVVRDVRRYPRLGDALRISLGTPKENGRVLEVLRGIPGAGVVHAAAMRAELPA